MGSILQTYRVVIDPLVWEVLLIILGITAALGLVYLLRIHIAYRMAKNRHRDPLGWVLLSFFSRHCLRGLSCLLSGITPPLVLIQTNICF